MQRTMTACGRGKTAHAFWILLALGCQSPSERLEHNPSPFDWTLGSWQGVRRAGADGSENPMKMRVESILGGAGQVEHLEVCHDGGVYRGFSVQVFDVGLGQYVRQYVNSTRGKFVRLEGEVDASRSTWESVSPQRTRDSRLVSERLASNQWRRTQSVSENGGRTWRVLWEDVLQASD